VDYTLAGLDVLLHRIGWSVQVPARQAAERDEAAITAWKEADWPVLKDIPGAWMSSRYGRLREVFPVAPGGGLVVEGAGPAGPRVDCLTRTFTGGWRLHPGTCTPALGRMFRRAWVTRRARVTRLWCRVRRRPGAGRRSRR
jgi:hypothetical protein